MAEPLRALTSISRDETFQWLVNLQEDATTSAIDIQREYLRAAKERCPLDTPERQKLVHDWEEVLNDLSRINELQVAARTSSFSFKGKDTDIGTIARRLNVGAVLEGSVRRSGHTVRITAHLDNAVTGFHVWSQSYDRDLGDVLQLQTEIATAVAEALKVTLLAAAQAKI